MNYDKKEITPKEESKMNDSISNINDTINADNQMMQNNSATRIKYQK